MDFFRRVFNKSGSNPEISTSESSNDSSLFGGLEVNELEQVEEAELPDSSVQGLESSQSSFTSEFSFITQNATSSTANGSNQNESPNVALPSGPATTSDASADSSLPRSPRALKKSGSPKSSTKKSAKKSSATSDSSFSSGSASAAQSTPKKRVKKRTLENRPGYAASEGDSTAETGNSRGEPNSPAVAPQANPSEPTPTASPSKEPHLPEENRELVLESKGPESQLRSFEMLQSEHEAQIGTYKASLRMLAERIKLSYVQRSEIYSELGSLERKQLDLRSAVKKAELEENFDKAADFNAEIDSNQVLIDGIVLNMEAQEAEMRQLEHEKVEILKSFATAQIHHCHQLSRLKMLQNDVVKHIDGIIADLESETTTVYASKIELLEERLDDVESELARILDREQKVEAKIAAGAQGLVESLQEDSETVEKLEKEVSNLRATLALKEAELLAVQTRLKSNQTKVDALRKEQGEYLEDILSDKHKKMDLLTSLRLEKSAMDLQLVKQHEKIDLQKQRKADQTEIQVAVALAQEDFQKLIDASQRSIELFSTPLIPSSTTSHGTSALSSNDSQSNSYTEGQKTTDEIHFLDELKSQWFKHKKQLELQTEQIAAKNVLLQGARTEIEAIQKSQPLMEQSKQAAVATRDYKEAARLKTEIANATALLEQRTQESEMLSADIQQLQRQLIEQQIAISALQESIRAAEAQNAEALMADLNEKRKLIAAELKALRSDSRANMGSLLHDEARLVSISQLEGVDLATYGEQKFLALKFGLSIPELIDAVEEDTSLPEDTVVVEDTVPLPVAVQVQENDSSAVLASEAVPVDTSEPDQEESSGLFDGLEESQADVDSDEVHVSEEVVEEKSEPAIIVDDSETLDESKIASECLEKEIQDIEAQITEAEAQEDYERAAALHEQSEALKAQLASITPQNQ
jgi:hypothetical protein